ncbi:MAG: hypothetical protein ACOX6N_04830 [Patescibacteria group bacterium]|jgi:hypothetical protein
MTTAEIKQISKVNFVEENRQLTYEENVVVIGVEDLNDQRLEGLAKLYADVFAPPPWNEAVKCDSCESFRGVETSIGSRCECGGTFYEAYPLEETMEYIREEAAKPGFRLALIEEDNEVVAFAWSYLISPNDLAVKKWDLEEDQRAVIDLLKQRTNGNGEIRYLSECGISPVARGKGLANKLTECVQGPEISVIRTNCSSPMMAVAERMGYEQLMGKKMIIDRSKKVFIDTGEIANRLDTQNPQRTLLAR